MTTDPTTGPPEFPPGFSPPERHQLSPRDWFATAEIRTVEPDYDTAGAGLEITLGTATGLADITLIDGSPDELTAGPAALRDLAARALAAATWLETRGATEAPGGWRHPGYIAEAHAALAVGALYADTGREIVLVAWTLDEFTERRENDEITLAELLVPASYAPGRTRVPATEVDGGWSVWIDQ